MTPVKNQRIASRTSTANFTVSLCIHSKTAQFHTPMNTMKCMCTRYTYAFTYYDYAATISWLTLVIPLTLKQNMMAQTSKEGH